MNEDIKLVENYLKIIDKDVSLMIIEMYGRVYIIEFCYVNVSEVVVILWEVYGNCVVG